MRCKKLKEHSGSSWVDWQPTSASQSVGIAASGCTFYFCQQVPVWDITNIPPFDIQTFPVGFGIIVFSYTAHAVFPSIEGSMKKPDHFNSMMNASFAIAAVVKACLGTFMVLR